MHIGNKHNIFIQETDIKTIFIPINTTIDIMALINNCGIFFNNTCVYKSIGMYFINIAFFPCLEIAEIEILIKENNI